MPPTPASPTTPLPHSLTLPPPALPPHLLITKHSLRPTALFHLCQILEHVLANLLRLPAILYSSFLPHALPPYLLSCSVGIAVTYTRRGRTHNVTDLTRSLCSGQHSPSNAFITIDRRWYGLSVRLPSAIYDVVLMTLVRRRLFCLATDGRFAVYFSSVRGSVR